MPVVKGLENGDLLPRGPVVSLGIFDGVHVGHAAIAAGTLELARELGTQGFAVTFDPHPDLLLRPAGFRGLLTTLEERAKLLAVQGMKTLFIIPFDHILAGLDPESFVKRILLETLGVKGIVVGSNFTFGKGAAGNVSLLSSLAGTLGFAVRVIPPVILQGKVVSSTLIRRLLSEGMVETAALYLGRPPSLQGRVLHGDGRGRTLGFPTANLETAPHLCMPAQGVYAGRAIHRRRVFPCVVNIGTRPTFGGSRRLVEAHLLDYHGDLYGCDLEILLLGRLRRERRFESEQALREQIAADIRSARTVLQEGS
ncbi:MAG: bifunctional riboflavin kinase/FAD synthetase [Firmicutes bacterium]|nr:bifunctional riboflavin kinase/FAD synthetase [Bacillota bacterium]